MARKPLTDKGHKGWQLFSGIFFVKKTQMSTGSKL
jgi:hypothetical protein